MAVQQASTHFANPETPFIPIGTFPALQLSVTIRIRLRRARCGGGRRGFSQMDGTADFASPPHQSVIGKRVAIFGQGTVQLLITVHLANNRWLRSAHQQPGEHLWRQMELKQHCALVL